MKKDIHKRSLEILKKFLSETPKEEVDKVFSKYEYLDNEGYTIDEYLCITQEEFSKTEDFNLQENTYMIVGNRNEFEIPPDKSEKKINKKDPEDFQGLSFCINSYP
jgi:hypothetical protein